MTGYINGPLRDCRGFRRPRANKPEFSRNVAACPPGADRGPREATHPRPRADAPPVLENFVAAANADLLAALCEAVPVADVPQHIFLWATPAAAAATCCAASSPLCRPGRPAGVLPAGRRCGRTLPEAPGLLAIDDVEALGPDAQIALFRAFNGARGQRMTSITSGRAARSTWRCAKTCAPHRPEPDLRGQGPHRRRPRGDPPAQAATRGLRLEPEIVQYLLRHGRRDSPACCAPRRAGMPYRWSASAPSPCPCCGKSCSATQLLKR